MATYGAAFEGLDDCIACQSPREPELAILQAMDAAKKGVPLEDSRTLVLVPDWWLLV